jgi:predicted small integral membrane protein
MSKLLDWFLRIVKLRDLRQADYEWMAWTTPTAIFFSLIVAMLTFMIVWDVRSHPVMQKGFLPISTDRGDRLYIGLIGMAFINLAWLGFTDFSQWFALIICFVWLVIILKWG